MSALDQMHVFVRVVSLGSFTAAADAMGLPKSTVSRQVARLEDRLGVRLLHRTTRSLRPTEAGEAYFARAVRIVADVEEVEELVSRNQSTPRGTLRVTAPISFGHMYLGGMVSAFLEEYPDVSLSLDLSDRKVDLVEEGYDLAIRVGVLDDSSLVARRLGSARRVICASPAYLARRGTPLAPADLRNHEVARYAYAQGSSWRLAGGATVQVDGRLTCNNGEVLRDAAIAGLALAYLPAFIVADALHDGRLVSVLEAFLPEGGGVYALYPHHRNLSSKVRAFVDFAALRFASPPWESR